MDGDSVLIICLMSEEKNSCLKEGGGREGSTAYGGHNLIMGGDMILCLLSFWKRGQEGKKKNLFPPGGAYDVIVKKFLYSLLEDSDKLRFGSLP